MGGGAGQSTVDVVVPGEEQLGFGATLLSGEAPVPAGGLTEASQNPTSARPYPVTFSGPSSVHVVAQGDGSFAATLRSVGVGNDDGATGGAREPSAAWVVMPAIAGEPSRPRIVLVNPGNTSVTVTLHALATEGETAARRRNAHDRRRVRWIRCRRGSWRGSTALRSRSARPAATS